LGFQLARVEPPSSCAGGIDRIVGSRAFKPLFNMGSRTITAATQVPVPDSDAARALLTSGYLPPALVLDGAMAEAARRWREAQPDFIPVSR
jgi:hypothetical protein